MLIKRAILCTTLATVLAAPALVAAQPQQPPPAQTEFVPVDELPEQEQLPAAPLVIGAYAVAWVAILLYLGSIWRRLGKVDRELAEVSRRIVERSRT